MGSFIKSHYVCYMDFSHQGIIDKDITAGIIVDITPCLHQHIKKLSGYLKLSLRELK